MHYQCRSCSYQGSRAGSGGSCPACGSFDMQIARRGAAAPPAKKRTTQLIVLAGLWLVFGGMVVYRLVA